MNDLIIVRLDSEQADLIIKALHDFREKFYERSLMDNDLDKPRVRRSLDVIDGLKIYLKQEMSKTLNFINNEG